MTLLAHVGETGSCVRDVLPGMLVAGFGLGVAVVSVSIAILTGARERRQGWQCRFTESNANQPNQRNAALNVTSDPGQHGRIARRVSAAVSVVTQRSREPPGANLPLS